MDTRPSTSSSDQRPQGQQPQKAHGRLLFDCQEPGCGRAFKRPSQLQAHTRWHKGTEEYVCSLPECKLRFRTKYDLQQHMSTHTGEKPYICEICNRRYTAAGSLGRHKKIHNPKKELAFGDYMCNKPNCGKSYKRSSQLRAHLRWHDGKSEFVCEWPGCEMRFKNSSKLERHTLTHKVDKKYECDVCKLTLAQQGYLSKHKKTHNREELVCHKPGCGKILTNINHLRAHRRWHEGLEMYICNLQNCGMSFGTKQGLQKHMRTHTGEKPFECDVCKKCFREKHNLKKHMKLHIPEGPSETRGTQNEEATHSGTRDVPVETEGESTENEERDEEENSN